MNNQEPKKHNKYLDAAAGLGLGVAGAIVGAKTGSKALGGYAFKKALNAESKDPMHNIVGAPIAGMIGSGLGAIAGGLAGGSAGGVSGYKGSQIVQNKYLKKALDKKEHD